MRLRRATVADLDTVGALFDDAVRWLTEQGRPGQWGTEPFSTNPRRMETMRRWLAGEAWIAEVDGRAAGFMALGEPQDHIPPTDVPELYVSGLVGARFPAARGAGRLLLKHAEARAVEEGVERIRVDCYAGDDRALVAFYVSAGFTPTDTFMVDTWPGQVLELRLRCRTSAHDTKPSQTMPAQPSAIQPARNAASSMSAALTTAHAIASTPKPR